MRPLFTKFHPKDHHLYLSQTYIVSLLFYLVTVSVFAFFFYFECFFFWGGGGGGGGEDKERKKGGGVR